MRYDGRLGVAMAVMAVVLGGCGGPGKTVPLGVQAESAPPQKVQTPLRVAVTPFVDARTDKAAIGRYQHYSESTVDRLVPAKGSAAEQVTDFVAGYLKRAGFDVVRAEGDGSTAQGVDVVLRGKIESYWNEAIARFLRTEEVSKNRLAIEVVNRDNSATVRTTVTGDATSKVFWFDLSDLEALEGEALAQSMEHFLQEMVVADRTLQRRK